MTSNRVRPRPPEPFLGRDSDYDSRPQPYVLGASMRMSPTTYRTFSAELVWRYAASRAAESTQHVAHPLLAAPDQLTEGAIVAAHRARDDVFLGRIFEPAARVTRPGVRHLSALRNARSCVNLEIGE